MRKTTKALVTFATLLLILTPVLAFAAEPADLGLGDAENLGLPGSADADPKEAAVQIVRYLMTFLGLIAVLVILYGGFIWLTAGGNEDKVGKAKKTIVAGIIGLVIILAAYAIVIIVTGFAMNVLSST